GAQPGDRPDGTGRDPLTMVAVEDPGYPPRIAFSALGAQVAHVRSMPRGWWWTPCRTTHIVYVTPSIPVPAGHGLEHGAPRRAGMGATPELRCCSKTTTTVNSFAGPADGVAQEPGQDRRGGVGTFSKTIFPELRIGYVVPRHRWPTAVCRAGKVGDAPSCTMTQTALAKFMLDGYFGSICGACWKCAACRRTCCCRTWAMSPVLALRRPPVSPGAGEGCGRWGGLPTSQHQRRILRALLLSGIHTEGNGRRQDPVWLWQHRRGRHPRRHGKTGRGDGRPSLATLNYKSSYFL
ncbi:hypothetical protein ACRAWF_11460, partial [Streptomyces sp. L7]